MRKKIRSKLDYLMYSQTSIFLLLLCFEIFSVCLKAISTKMWILLKKCDAINFTGCNELLVPCHCCGTLTIIDGYWYIENEWMNIEKRLHKIFIGWERYLYLGLDWFLKVTKCSRVYLSLIFCFTLIIFLLMIVFYCLGCSLWR